MNTILGEACSYLPIDFPWYEGEVMSVALVHHFHAESGTIHQISPGVQDAALTIKD
jgi:hypothetical protein